MPHLGSILRLYVQATLRQLTAIEQSHRTSDDIDDDQEASQTKLDPLFCFSLIFVGLLFGVLLCTCLPSKDDSLDELIDDTNAGEDSDNDF